MRRSVSCNVICETKGACVCRPGPLSGTISGPNRCARPECLCEWLNTFQPHPDQGDCSPRAQANPYMQVLFRVQHLGSRILG